MAESIVCPWAKDKLDRLEKYPQAYTTIMRKQPWYRMRSAGMGVCP